MSIIYWNTRNGIIFISSYKTNCIGRRGKLNEAARKRRWGWKAKAWAKTFFSPHQKMSLFKLSKSNEWIFLHGFSTFYVSPKFTCWVGLESSCCVFLEFFFLFPGSCTLSLFVGSDFCTFLPLHVFLSLVCWKPSKLYVFLITKNSWRHRQISEGADKT